MNSFARLSLSAATLGLSFSVQSAPQPPAKAPPVREWVKRFRVDNPEQMQKVMDEPLVKYAVPAKVPPRSQPTSKQSTPDQKSISEKIALELKRGARSGAPVNYETLVKAKNRIRDKLTVLVGKDEKHLTKVQLGQARAGRAPVQFGDEAWRLMAPGELVIYNIHQMQRETPKKAALPIQPWSDDYWGIYKGQLGARYADPAFLSVQTERWRDYLAVIQQAPALTLLSETDRLSPSEKYDLVFYPGGGVPRMPLTTAQWAKAPQFEEPDGKIATWMGICHGWAPAAFMIDRPLRAVTVQSLSGAPILFYPSDIKALASLLWAQVPPPARFVGGRCNEKDPRRSLAGRLLDQQCFDTNPRSWHQAVVGKIGVAKKSFVMDVTFDYEVWNQPVHAYEFSYFNPLTRDVVERVEDGIVPLASLSQDAFREFRGSATHLVGVVMDVTYIVETEPTTSPIDAPWRDGLRTMRLTYDLELDAQGNMLGGEWYTNAHPDFLWSFDDSAQSRHFAVTKYEGAATAPWLPNASAPPLSWVRAVEGAAQSQQSPLAKFVLELVRRASN